MTNLTRPDASQIAFGTRTLAARLDDYTNVKDFGAVGDGVTDDTAAIQAAVTAALIAGKKRLRFPSGNYLHSGILATLTSSDWEIIGEQGFRSEEHTSELQSLMRISYAVFCLKKKRSEYTRDQSKTRLSNLQTDTQLVL